MNAEFVENRGKYIPAELGEIDNNINDIHLVLKMRCNADRETKASCSIYMSKTLYLRKVDV